MIISLSLHLLGATHEVSNEDGLGSAAGADYHFWSSAVWVVHVQDLLEGPPEVHVTPGVYDRVDGGVDVAEPRDHVDEHLGRWTARLAEREEQVDDEER